MISCARSCAIFDVRLRKRLAAAPHRVDLFVSISRSAENTERNAVEPAFEIRKGAVEYGTGL